MEGSHDATDIILSDRSLEQRSIKCSVFAQRKHLFYVIAGVAVFAGIVVGVFFAGDAYGRSKNGNSGNHGTSDSGSPTMKKAASGDAHNLERSIYLVQAPRTQEYNGNLTLINEHFKSAPTVRRSPNQVRGVSIGAIFKVVNLGMKLFNMVSSSSSFEGNGGSTKCYSASEDMGTADAVPNGLDWQDLVWDDGARTTQSFSLAFPGETYGYWAYLNFDFSWSCRGHLPNQHELFIENLRPVSLHGYAWYGQSVSASVAMSDPVMQGNNSVLTATISLTDAGMVSTASKSCRVTFYGDCSIEPNCDDAVTD